MLAPVIQSDVLAWLQVYSGQPATWAQGLPDQWWVDVLNFANQVNLTSCDSDYDRRLARILMVAHMGLMTSQGASGIAGPMTSESAGGVRESYGLVAMGSDTALSTTRYGQVYLDLVRSTACGLPSVA